MKGSNMSEILINKCVVGMISTNCYLISNVDTKEVIIIDPADSYDILVRLIEEKNLNPVAIMLTHGHFDHILAAHELGHKYKINIYAGKEEKQLLEDSRLNCSLLMSKEIVVTPDILLQDGEDLTIGGMNIKVIHTPGHTAGSVCYYFYDNNVLVTGDTLFNGCIGRTDLPTGSSKLIMSSIKSIMMLEDNIKVLPGHDDETTIGYERKNNMYLKLNS